MQTQSYLKRFYGFILVMIALGVVFRFINLDDKIFWHDEVFTALRAAGFSTQEIYQELFVNRWVSTLDVHPYMQLKPDSTLTDTFASLAREEPQHPPLYFWLTRIWMQVFGGSITALRLLPAIISVLSLPMMYSLAQILWADRLISVLATALLAIAPFEIVFAQNARQYSLQLFLTIVSSWLLLRAIRQPKWRNWTSYVLTSVLGFYTHLFFSLTLASHGVFLLGRALWIKKQRMRLLWQGGSALMVTGLFTLPWFIILKVHLSSALAATRWVYDGGRNLMLLLKAWTINASFLFFDVDFGRDNWWNYPLRVPFVLVIFVSLWYVGRTAKINVRLFILTAVMIPFLILAVPDIVQGGQRSAIERYVIVCYPAVLIAVAYWLKQGLFAVQGQRWRRWVYPFILGVIVTSGVVSDVRNGLSEASWTMFPSNSNGMVARYVNAHQPAIFMGDRGWGYTNLGDMLSMSYLLDHTVPMVFLSHPPQRDFLTQIRQKLPAKNTKIFLFRPTEALRAILIDIGGEIKDSDSASDLKQWVLEVPEGVSVNTKD